MEEKERKSKREQDNKFINLTTEEAFTKPKFFEDAFKNLIKKDQNVNLNNHGFASQKHGLPNHMTGSMGGSSSNASINVMNPSYGKSNAGTK